MMGLIIHNIIKGLEDTKKKTKVTIVQDIYKTVCTETVRMRMF